MSAPGTPGATRHAAAGDLAEWLATEPVLDGTLATDAARLAAYAAEGDALLAAMPPRLDRSPEQLARAARIHDSCRRVRSRFAHRHAAELYAELTGSMTRYLRLPELCYTAAERYPGLLPTRERIAREAQHIQAGKEGWEIDQGIFLRAVLRLPEEGRHLMDAMLRPTPRAEELLPAFAREGRVELATLLLERRGPAAHLTFRNPRALNAEDNQLIADMETAVDLALLDERVRVGVLRGGVMTHPRYQGRRVFSAGINLSDLHRGRIGYLDFLMGREMGYIAKLVHGLLTEPDPAAWPRRTVDKPWIAAVDTFAIGGGMQLLLAVDHVLAAADSYLCLPAAQEGIIPGASNFRLTRIAGAGLARQIILGGRKLWAAEPEARCLVDEVVEPGEMDRAVEAAVAHFDSPAVVGNRRMMNLTDEPLDAFRAYLAEFAVEQALRIYSRDVIDKVERRYAARSRRAAD